MSKSIMKNASTIPCFVCNNKVVGERVSLATAVAPQSKIGLPEKISQLIGDDFVVVVTEQDVVCKRCVSLLVHIDKLENELSLVKKAVLTYIKHKYNLPLDENSIVPAKKGPPQAIGSKQDRNESDESEARTEPAIESPPPPPPQPLPILAPSTPAQQNASALTAASSGIRKRPAPAKLKDGPLNSVKPKLPALDTTPQGAPKMKIYKCGFCTFQSKELNNVRNHMKLHVKSNKTEEEPAATTPVSKPATTPSAVTTSSAAAAAAASAKRRLFRCQVCSSSFDEKIKCLEHISKEHTPKKKTEERKLLSDFQDKATVERASSVEQHQQQQQQRMEEDLDNTNDLSVVKNELAQQAMDESYADTALQYDNTEASSTLNEEMEQSKIDEKTDIEDDVKKDKVHAIDIEAMIAALHSDGPTDPSE